MFASAKGKQQKKVRQLQCQEQCIDHIPYYLSGLSRAQFLRQPNLQIAVYFFIIDNYFFALYNENIGNKSSFSILNILWNIFRKSVISTLSNHCIL